VDFFEKGSSTFIPHTLAINVGIASINVTEVNIFITALNYWK
jgi:hypothetical protein